MTRPAIGTTTTREIKIPICLTCFASTKPGLGLKKHLREECPGAK